MLEDLDRLPPDVRARIERELAETERDLTVAETEIPEPRPPQPWDRVVIIGPVAPRSHEIALPKALDVVKVIVDTLSEHARAHYWSASRLRSEVERVIPAALRYLFEQFWHRGWATFDAFRNEVTYATRRRPWWRTYQDTLAELSAPPPFHVQLQALRKEAGWTVEKLAEEAGLSPRAVATHLNGTVPPGADSLERYNAAFSRRLGPTNLLG